MNEYKELNDRFPFLTYGRYLDKDYIGVVQNSDQQFISMYIYNDIKDDKLKKKFLQYGETWWWESNRKISINMFLHPTFKIFRPFLKTFVSKEFEYIFGPKVCLDDMMEKRIKRRSIQLIRKID